MLESEKDLVAKMLRAVLQANKHGVPLSRLQGEYKSLTGEFIPFKAMGFSTLEACLKANPSVVKVEVSRVGEVTCFAVVNKETAQIAELVARQRSSKKKAGGQVNCYMRLKSSSSVTHIGKPKATLRKPGFSSQQEKPMRRPAPLSARGRVNVWSSRPAPESIPLVAPPVYVTGILRDVPMQRHPSVVHRPERKATLPPRFQKDGSPVVFHSSQVDSNANNMQAMKTSLLGSLPPNLSVVQSNLRELFGKYGNGVWMSKLPHLYRFTFKQDLNDEVLKQIVNWSHICTVQKLTINGQLETVLYPQTKKTPTSVKPPQQRSSDQVKANVSPVHTKSPSHQKQTASTVSDAELKQNISEILKKYSNGLWSHALPKVFEDTFKKQFPPEVLQNLDSLSDICTVDLVSGEPYKAILYAKTSLNEDHTVSANKSIDNKTSTREQEAEPLPMEQLSEESSADLIPPPLVIPSEASPSVLVVELSNTNEVVVRYVGQEYSAAQERLEDDMKEFYSKSSLSVPVSSLKTKQLVAVRAEEDAWLRAQISSFEGNKIKVFYVDYGFGEVVDSTKICRLDKQFYSLAFQATKCRLAGLEAFCEDSIILKAVESNACGKILAVEILEKSEQPLVVLYDTSGDDDININAMCLRELCDKSLTIQLKANSSYTNVVVTNVCSDGTLVCQVPSKGLTKLSESLQKIESYFNSMLVTSEVFVSLPFCGKMCLFNCKGKWSRVEITSVHSSRALDVQFLDTGTIASVKVSELREIPTAFLRDFISIPPQAVKCCLADLPLNIGMWTPDAVLWLRNTVLNCSECSIKIVKMDETKGMAYVYLFTKKNCPDPEKSINRQITNEELWKHQKDVFLSINSGGASMAKGKSDATTHGPGAAHVVPHKEPSIAVKKIIEQDDTVTHLDLPPPLSLPKPGEHLDIFVSLACHPGHFVFQSWQELHKLEVLMEEMLLHYSTTEEKLVTLEKNKIYAAKVDNKSLCKEWRPSIQCELSPCRTARDAGVKCEQWSEEASIVFRNHVEQKPLVALVQTVYESSNPWDRKVVAYIVDTSLPDTDIWIHDFMSEYLVELMKAE
ncbi:tudor domain-containing protein 7 [Bombina bombina]|uniref:tudor domain-containing protein 7 n=1 Tax=Bombina bombina TaxID=8345 RepID=UPI00235A770A|nr:tudor domain-containing protein 7 [Bombina bombina]